MGRLKKTFSAKICRSSFFKIFKDRISGASVTLPFIAFVETQSQLADLPLCKEVCFKPLRVERLLPKCAERPSNLLLGSGSVREIMC